MPKLKESLGKVQLQTAVMEEFQRWLCYELKNAQDWNKELIEGGMEGYRRWKFKMMVDAKQQHLWTIEYDGQRIHVTSDEPVVHIRQGLRIRMGTGRLELG